MSVSAVADAVNTIINLTLSGSLVPPHTHTVAKGGPLQLDSTIRFRNALQPIFDSDSQILNRNLNADLWRGHRYTVQGTAPTNSLPQIRNQGDLVFDGLNLWVWTGTKWIAAGGSSIDNAYYLLTKANSMLPNGVVVTGYPFNPADGGTGTATAFTPGSIVFAGASGVYSQNNAKLFWDNIGGMLVVGASSGSGLGERLHLVTTNGVIFVNESNDPNARIILLNTGASGTKWSLMSNGAGSVGTTSGFGIRDETGTGNTRFTIDSAGNVGMGTTTPGSKLEVNVGAAIGNDASARLGNSTAGSGNLYLGIGRTGATSGVLQIAGLKEGVGSNDLSIQGNGGNVAIGSNSAKTTLDIRGGFSVAVATKTATYTMTTSDYMILADATAAAFTVTLPAASNTGMKVVVVKIDSSVNAVTVSRAGADTIEGANTLSLATQYKKANLIADGSAKWYDLGAGLV